MWSMALETLGSRVARSTGVWVSCPGKALAGAAGAAPDKGLVGGVHLALLLFMFLAWHCFDRLVALASLLCPAKCARAQVKGSKGEPLLLYTDSLDIFIH